ncbi:DUF4097 family beta strand repeat protein [Chloracidobacterium validum]|uniref:DUF4097 family beta strand repeat protein n=1 Tax=Chloracidobacterium validum TaxID=2821543 RepID=A0ABX8BHU7_9BACT|nr:DUF4097 family beta strand repeat-containing protein [Chloracidobacterium validum]QUW04620.1 DUF4097 family beta strand repeat protein [Chloracidobacterium validum]
MRTVLSVARGLALVWVVGCVPALAQEIRQPLEGNGRVAVECWHGQVSITGKDEQVLTIATDGDASTIKLKRLDDGGYQVSIEPPKTPHRLQISVPRQLLSLDVKTRSAGVQVSDVATLRVATISGNVLVGQVSGEVSVATTSGDVKLNQVGAARLQTVSGSVSAQMVTQELSVSTVSGRLNASDIGGDVTAQLVSGSAEIRCGRGRVEVSTVSGDVKLARLENEIAVETTSGSVLFAGALTPVKRCSINAFSGDIRLVVPETCGFEAKFKSFSGTIKSDFPLDGSDAPERRQALPSPPGPPVVVGAPQGMPGLPPPPPPRRPPPPRQGSYIVWRHGDGAAKVFLNTFSGKVLVVRDTSPGEPPCVALPR